MGYNSATSSLWDFPNSPSGFSQLAENDFLALLQKQFNPDPSNAYAMPHDGVVDPSKITNLPAAVPPPPLSDDSSPSPPSTNDRLSSSRRLSTNSATEQDAHELKRKASVDAFEDDNPSQKACSSLSSQMTSCNLPLTLLASLSEKVPRPPKTWHFSGEHSTFII